jgi:hypothetical protein
MEPKRLTEEEINSAVSLAVREAIDFVESEVAPDRIKAQRYFDGKSDLGYEDGRSKVVATKVRDTIRAIKPALMRVFLQTDKPVEFIPRTPQAVMAAEQATKYASYIFNRNNGFDVISDVFHDALIKKVGIAKVYYDENPDVEFDEYTGLTEQQAQLVEMDEEVEVIEMTVTQEAEIDEMGMEVMPALYDMKVAKASRRGEIKIKSVAPEDFFVDRSAVSIDDCYVCGHSSEGRVGDLVEMGFDFDRIYSLSGETDSATDQEEDFIRRGWDESDESDSNIDPSMRKILITEAYMRMDIEGVGVPKLYKFLCAGQDHEVLDYELCDYNPFAVFEVDPEPHTFFGRSLADIIIEDQNVATSLLRGLLDNIAMLNNPRLIVNDQAVEMDDVLNSEIGGIIRTSDIGAVREIAVGGAAASALPAIQFYDEVIRAKTGVSGAAMGLDADALQSQTAAGVNAAVQAATAVSELIARTLAEGGMKQLFKTIAKLARANPNPDEMMRIDGQFIPVDPSSWGVDLDTTTNVGLGNGAHDQRMAMMQQALQLQMQVYAQYGPMNGIVTMTGIRNTVADMMALGGIHNADRYIQPMNPQIEQQLMMQAQQMQAMQQQGQGDPNMAFMQTEQMKAQTRAQVDMQKAAMEHQRKMLEMAQNNDLQRDGMAQDLLIEAAKILGQYGTSVDVERVKAEQNAPRQFMPMQGMM